jgi:hypothetical protein
MLALGVLVLLSASPNRRAPTTNVDATDRRRRR